MEQYSVYIYSVVIPPVPSPSEAFYMVSPDKYRIKPEVTAVYQPYIGKTV